MELNPYTTPQSEPHAAYEKAVPLTPKQILFSFKGRIGRQTFWVYSILTYIVLAIIGFAFGTIFESTAVDVATSSGTIESLEEQYSGSSDVGGSFLPTDSIVGLALFGIIYIFFFWAYIAISAKRCHDRAKSGWFQLISIIPLIGGLWLLVELGFLRGTQGPNQYGNDPLG